MAIATDSRLTALDAIVNDLEKNDQQQAELRHQRELLEDGLKLLLKQCDPDDAAILQEAIVTLDTIALVSIVRRASDLSEATEAFRLELGTSLDPWDNLDCTYHIPRRSGREKP